MNNEKNKPQLHAFMVTGNDKNPFFTKVGAAWQNKSGGFQLYLDAYPKDGKVVLLPPKDKPQA